MVVINIDISWAGGWASYFYKSNVSNEILPFTKTPQPLSSVLIFNEQVEQTVNFAMDKYNNGTVDIINLLSCKRESLGVSKILRKRLFSM